MSKSSSSSDLQETAGFFGGLVRQARLAWRLLRDGRVPGWVKVIPAIGLVYLLSPIDLIPDWVLPGLGQMDDIALILLALKMFVDLSPPGIVSEHVNNLSGAGKNKRADDTAEGPTIDATYSLLDEGLAKVHTRDREQIKYLSKKLSPPRTAPVRKRGL